ncbi:MAG: hypothetical protein WCE21_01100 [Candidatus Babeliales bacterium]
MKKLFILLAAIMAGGCTIATPQPINMEQVGEMANAFKLVACYVRDVQESLNHAVEAGARTDTDAYRMVCEACEQLKERVASLGQYKNVPGFAIQVWNLTDAWREVRINKFCLPEYLNASSSQDDLDYWGLPATYGAIASIAMIVSNNTNEEIFPYILAGTAVLWTGYLTSAREVNNKLIALDMQIDAFKKAFETGPREQVQLSFNALLDVR